MSDPAAISTRRRDIEVVPERAWRRIGLLAAALSGRRPRVCGRQPSSSVAPAHHTGNRGMNRSALDASVGLGVRTVVAVAVDLVAVSVGYMLARDAVSASVGRASAWLPAPVACDRADLAAGVTCFGLYKPRRPTHLQRLIQAGNRCGMVAVVTFLARLSVSRDFIEVLFFACLVCVLRAGCCFARPKGPRSHRTRRLRRWQHHGSPRHLASSGRGDSRDPPSLDEDDDRRVDEHVFGTAGGTDERCVEGMTAATGPPYASSRVARHDCVSRHVARRHRTGTNH